MNYVMLKVRKGRIKVMELLIFFCFAILLLVLVFGFENKVYLKAAVAFLIVGGVSLLFSFSFLMLFTYNSNSLIVGICVFLAGEIAAATYLILNKMNHLKSDKHDA